MLCSENFETKAIFCLSVLFLFLFFRHIWSRYQKLSCPSDSPTTLFCTPHAVNHQNRAQRFSEVRDVQLDLCHHLRTAVTSQILTCQGRKDRHCTVTVLKYWITVAYLVKNIIKELFYFKTEYRFQEEIIILFCSQWTFHPGYQPSPKKQYQTHAINTAWFRAHIAHSCEFGREAQSSQAEQLLW